MVIELDGASESRQVHELDGGQDLDRRPVIPEAAAVVIELGQVMSRALRRSSPWGLVAKPSLRSGSSIKVMELDGCQGLDYSRSLRAPPSHPYLSMFESGSRPGDEPGLAAIVALGPRGEAAASLKGIELRSRAAIVVVSSARISIGCRWSRRAWPW